MSELGQFGLPVPPPTVNLETQRFWDATAEGRLVLPRCDDSGDVVWYPRERCDGPGSTSVTWFEASGRGTVYSCTVTRRIPGSWRKAAPFVLAYVELEEGPRVLTNIVGCDPDTVHIGQAVQAVFDPTPDGPALLRFTPA
ncbi:Zn-ribbon domain-containing OB-fold protein [Candidatus Poriferisodalis sp.]|uniref:Zn-ribbon domain-containing OB-fold protein n=1 Tax=Candidatus Poriferisodalis sp. TaxID=3101277 RepID=UPI003B019C9F